MTTKTAKLMSRQVAILEKYLAQAGSRVLLRRWGRLTDTGVSGRVDSYNDYFDTRQEAEKAMSLIRNAKTRKGYNDISREREYPIGLGSAGFGWGGQAACRIIPELKVLQDEVIASEAWFRRFRKPLADVARQDSSMAKKLGEMLEEALTAFDNMNTYLEHQLSSCR